MPSFYITDEPVLLVKTNPARTRLSIGNLSDTTVYVKPDGELQRFTERAWPILQNGVHDICLDTNGYKGPVYCMVSAVSDVRVWES